MNLLRMLSLRSARPILVLALAASLAACTSSDGGSTGTGGQYYAGQTGGNSLSPVTGGANTATTGGTPLLTTGGNVVTTGTGGTSTTTGGTASNPGTDSGVPNSMTGGSMGSSNTASGLPSCEGGAKEACGAFVTNSGETIQLGPYGSIMEANVGAGFENPVAAGDADSNATCTIFASLFGAPKADNDALLNTMDLDFSLYTVYRPANAMAGETFPLITWGNGTCAQPEGYGALLRYVASYGYVIVAANSRWVGGGNNEMNHALDFMIAANADSSSPYYQLIDPDKIGAMGHSQGSAATATAASDSRIKSVILFNGGTSAVKPFLGVSGDMDINNPTVADYQSGVNGATEGAFLFFHNIPPYGTGGMDGHLTLMTQPERVTEPTTMWWDYMLKDDQSARDWFVGASCTLCAANPDYDYGQKGLH